MAQVIGVRFKNTNKIYYFDPGGFDCTVGGYVVVETARGVELGEVVTAVKSVEQEELVAPLKKVVRVATEADIQMAEKNRSMEQEGMELCAKRIIDLKLDMKLVDCEYAFDGSKIIFYFTSDGRVDFRELVKVLAQTFRTRIELRQIGVRDEAKMIGGLGNCGREICCRQFLGDFQPVTIRMARDQGLSLNPTKISGLCGRLMCCLKYEQDTYESVRKRMPKLGKEVVTPDGEGTVTELNVISEKIKVRLSTGGTNHEVREFPMDEVSRKHPVQQQPKEAQQAPEAENEA